MRHGADKDQGMCRSFNRAARSRGIMNYAMLRVMPICFPNVSCAALLHTDTNRNTSFPTTRQCKMFKDKHTLVLVHISKEENLNANFTDFFDCKKHKRRHLTYSESLIQLSVSSRLSGSDPKFQFCLGELQAFVA